SLIIDRSTQPRHHTSDYTNLAPAPRLGKSDSSDFFNGLLNAVDLNEAGSSIRMQVRTIREQIVISLRDTGKGISRQQLKHLFDPYSEGPGDDLPIEMRLRSAIAKHLVQRHGGSISANSVSSSGTAFTVRLPKVSTPDTDATPYFPEDVELETSRPRSQTPSSPQAPASKPAGLRHGHGLLETPQSSDEADMVRVLVADENPTVRKILRNMFASLGWETLEVTDGRKALERARQRPVPHAIVLDLRLPEMSGYDVCRALKSDDQLQLIPVLVTTSADSPEEKLGALDAGADDILSKPINRAELTIRLRSLLRMHRFNQELIGAESVARTLALAVAAKDGYAQSHLEKVAVHSVTLGKAMGLDAAELKVLEFGALLHNVGKIAIPDAVLEKTGPLTPREKAMLQQHPRVGCDICAPLKPLKSALPVIRHHKENWDGTGYPDKLKGDEIPLGAQIVGIVDVYTALTSDRPYRRALSHADAIAVLQKETRLGRHNPELTERLVECLGSASGAEDSSRPEIPAPSACPEIDEAAALSAAAATDPH
ncbi:MAG: response regulator, partial [Planctomycetes bacterium]|nr:response regulator [Planctomycetota bacterium]